MTAAFAILGETPATLLTHRFGSGLGEDICVVGPMLSRTLFDGEIPGLFGAA